MEGGWFSNCGSRLSAAHNLFKHWQALRGLRAVPFQTVALALAPLAPSFQIVARISRIEGGSFSKCGSRLGAVHIR
eukprot:9273803-Pyramimonas_sp.AAC.1